MTCGAVACTERKKVEHSKVRVDLSTSTFIFSTRLKVDLSSTFFRLSSTFIFLIDFFLYRLLSTLIDFSIKSRKVGAKFLYFATLVYWSLVQNAVQSSLTVTVALALALQIQLADFFSSFFNVIFHLELEFSIIQV